MGKLPFEVTKIALERYGNERLDPKQQLMCIQHNGLSYAVTYQEACLEASEILGPREKLAADIGLHVLRNIAKHPSLTAHVNHLIQGDVAEMIKMLEEL